MFCGHLWWTFHWSRANKALWDVVLSAVCMPHRRAPWGLSLTHRPKNTTKLQHVACVGAINPLWSPFSPSFFSFHTGQLQFLQHQMQQQQMAMGTAAPQVGAAQQHTASQPRSKRKRSMPQPLPKSWKAPITLRTLRNTRGHEWFILCSSSASLWRQKQPFHVFF